MGTASRNLPDHPKGTNQNQKASPYDSIDEASGRHHPSVSRERSFRISFRLDRRSPVYLRRGKSGVEACGGQSRRIRHLPLHPAPHLHQSVGAGGCLAAGSRCPSRPSRYSHEHALCASGARHLRNSIATLEARRIERSENISRPTCERRGSPMHKCNFCQRDDFPSRQSFNAHCRWCDAYKQHKHNLNSASGTSVRQALPKAQPDQVTSPPIPSALLPHTNDPFAPFRDFLQGLGVPPPNADETQETPQQKRRRLLQAAKSRAIDHYWSLTRTVTTEMRAEARLAIDRELRDEPLEEFTPQEVRELAEGIREQVYVSFQRRQEKETRRAQEAEDRKRAASLRIIGHNKNAPRRKTHSSLKHGVEPSSCSRHDRSHCYSESM